MERRKFPRMVTNLPMEFYVHLLDSNQYLAGKGFLANISQGGMYFKCPQPFPLEDGSIVDFTFDLSSSPGLNDSRLKVSARVVRIEPPEKNSLFFGIAIQFLSRLNVGPDWSVDWVWDEVWDD
jgi:hypothetical protein